MKKTALGTLTFVLLSVDTLLLLVCPIQADTSYIPYPTEPSQEFPTLNVNSPKNAEVFTTTSVEVNFTVAKPESWNVYWLTTMPVIGSYIVDVYLDGSLHSQLFDPGSSGFPTANYSVFLNKLSRGGHSVKIDVEAFTFYDDPSSEPGDYLTYPKNITETIHFTVNADLPTPTPTPEPTPKAEPFPTTIIIGSAVAVAVVGLGLLVYFKKRGHARTNQHSEIEQPSI